MTKTRRFIFMREWRLARGMLQGELAKAVGTSGSLMSRYETGLVGMNFDLQLKVMRALRITPDEFWARPPTAPDTPQRLRKRQQFWEAREEAGQATPILTLPAKGD